jgi:ubiquinone/menaquinone biosynthesis C-methylase UbiE
MTIIKTRNSIEAYRARAKSKDINDLTGRTGRPDLTKYVITQIIKKIPIKNNSNIIDVGCGDGLFLIELSKSIISKFTGELVGILPTKEETERVKHHLAKNYNDNFNITIKINLGRIDKIDLPKSHSDVIVCNSVLHVGCRSQQDINMALKEFNRIMKTGGTLFIGELPDTDENVGKNYGESILSWLFWVFKNQGVQSLIFRLKQTIAAIFSEKLFIISPKQKMFHIKPDSFISLAKRFGFKIVSSFRHGEIDENGLEYLSKTRWNYIFKKI